MVVLLSTISPSEQHFFVRPAPYGLPSVPATSTTVEDTLEVARQHIKSWSPHRSLAGMAAKQPPSSASSHHPEQKPWATRPAPPASPRLDWTFR